MDSEHSWKQLRLSLERPYKDDHGNPIPVVEDITPGPTSDYIYETKDNPSARLGANLRRIFVERGLDFFDRISGDAFISSNSSDNEEVAETKSDEDEHEPKMMKYEDLREMREEILKNLAVSLGEMTQSQQVLAALLATPNNNSSLPSTQPSSQTQPEAHLPSQLQSLPSPNVNFSATLVTQPPSITSVQTFNAQLAIGGKDEALRHAAGLFKASAKSIERTRLAGERYWVDALKIRRSNWGLVPAPLPLGSATGKGADKTSKDFLISFGLEESPTQFRRRAVGRLPSYSEPSQGVVFPHRRNTRLRVSIVKTDPGGMNQVSANILPFDDETILDGALRAAQREIIEQEIFSILVQEAGGLLTASARVSERLIVIDAAQGLELQIELVDKPNIHLHSTEKSETCDLIYYGLHILLLRRHTLLKEDRLKSSAPGPPLPSSADNKPKYPVLQPVIDLLQYQVFIDRIQNEVVQVVRALQMAGIPVHLVMNVVGETSKELLDLLDSTVTLTVGGEIVLRIFDRHTIRFTCVSPSTLVAHLSNSTLTISSAPQLCQLLMDEVEHCLLNSIRDVGKNLTENIEGTWFIDLDHCIGRWEGCVL
ncbi:hypothetical protein AGABI2DRAFT_203249 [Agaricus bisporus var. bisporus H97]|uniref:hypothetical protein n=1 Tax=Agaricus bisporus var. bisporus (strain H97 / ATCC MYA-4626 / FGSC 10389) TaxID=936046 RepID=UPI00029F7598|nr:hypothetical protein AGABI2DRAFT_203249 [Agaricus bisporus var. bisporus H97]EKV48432.1 hypothetical protein AGABI2DRAFT_203249 [Agaricus bisporus var. bisporus H97]